jgi:hypothetical protein
MRQLVYIQVGLSLISVFSPNWATQGGPAISNTKPEWRRPFAHSGIRQLNPREMLVSNGGSMYQLTNGQFKSKDYDEDGSYLGAVEVDFGGGWVLKDLSGNERYFLLWWLETLIGGSSRQNIYVQLLTIEDKHLVIKQQLKFDPKGDKRTGVWFDEKAGLLKITAISSEGECNACPHPIDNATYRFDGSGFVLRSWRKIHPIKLD